MNGRENKPPVKQGDIAEVKVLGQGDKGDYLTKVNGYVIWIQNCKDLQKDDAVRIKITAALPNYGFAELVKENEETLEPIKDTEDF